MQVFISEAPKSVLFVLCLIVFLAGRVWAEGKFDTNPAWGEFDEKPDTEAPILEVTEPTNGEVTTRSWIEIRGTISDNSGRAHALINGVWAHGGFGDGFEHHRNRLTNGINHFVIVAQDDAMNSATQIVTVVLDPTSDTIAPTSELLLPWGDDGKAPTFCSVTSLDVDGTTDDETASIKIWVTTEIANSGPHVMVNSGTAFHSQISLLPGYNEIEMQTSDAAGNATTNNYAIFNDTSCVFRITYPRSYQVMNASSTEVWGVASPEFINAIIAINGINAYVFQRSNQVGFVSRLPATLNSGLTMIWAEALLNDKKYFTQ